MAVVKVVSEHGLQGATTARIARAAGVGPGTLYRHFSSRSEMFIAALEEVYQEIMAPWFEVSSDDALEKIRAVAERHSATMASGSGGFAVPWVEFIAGAPQVGLREAVADTQRRAYKIVESVIDEGKAQGRIRADVDTKQMSYEFLCYAWGENLSVLMGLNEFLGQGHSTRMLQRVLDASAADR
jgi:TetR/AcrR family transcriptional regulator, fatty acid metabolism regulator protein